EPRRLVLDEMDGVADQVGWMSDLLEAAPGLSVLATSRMPLRLLGETDLNVPELSLAAAGELFRRGMHREPDAADEGAEHEARIEALVAGIGPSPLAIELAAAWTRAFSIDELAERLELRPELLSDAPGMAPLTARF